MQRVQPQVKSILDTFIDFGNTSKIYKSRDFTQDADFASPVYNIWTFAKKTNNVSHLGEAYAARIDEPFREKPGAPAGNQNAVKNNPYLDKDCLGDKQYGTSTTYLRKQIRDKAPDTLDHIGKGKQYKTVAGDAGELGIVNTSPVPRPTPRAPAPLHHQSQHLTQTCWLPRLAFAL